MIPPRRPHIDPLVLPLCVAGPLTDAEGNWSDARARRSPLERRWMRAGVFARAPAALVAVLIALPSKIARGRAAAARGKPSWFSVLRTSPACRCRAAVSRTGRMKEGMMLWINLTPRIASPMLEWPPALQQCADVYVASSGLEADTATCRRNHWRRRRHPLRDLLSTGFTRAAKGQLAIRCTAAVVRAHRDRLTSTTLIVSCAYKIAMGKHPLGRPLIPPRRGEMADLLGEPRRASIVWHTEGARLMPPVATPARSSSAEGDNRRGV